MYIHPMHDHHTYVQYIHAHIDSSVSLCLRSFVHICIQAYIQVATLLLSSLLHHLRLYSNPIIHPKNPQYFFFGFQIEEEKEFSLKNITSMMAAIEESRYRNLRLAHVGPTFIRPHQRYPFHGRQQNGGGGGFNREMRHLSEMFSELNPMAEEFVPRSRSAGLVVNSGCNNYNCGSVYGVGGGVSSGFGRVQQNGGFLRRKRAGLVPGKQRSNYRTTQAQKEDVIKRTVYVSDIDHQVTEEQLAALFIACGQVVDCRICGDPNSVLRFAFIEFTDEDGARAALSMAGTMLGYYPVKVTPSKTAIAPVNPKFLPRSEDELEMCAKTIYCTNIDKKITQAELRLFFESICGQVYRMRMLGDYHHHTHIAFVEFAMAESATAALNCSGAVLGSLPLRVSPSKTPVRPRTSRQPPMH